jgi:hypothetical protein
MNRAVAGNDRNPTEFAERLERVIALQHRGDNDGAARGFMELFDDYPDDPRLPEEAGNIYLYAANQPLEAIVCYARALPLVDDPTELCFKTGFAHASAGDDAAASDWFGRAHRHTPTHAMTFLEVAKLLMRRGQHQDALDHLDTAWAHHVMATGLIGGPNPHFRALVLMNQARIRLIHLDRVDAGMRTVKTLLDEMEDLQRVRTLANELRSAGKEELATRVLAMLDARHAGGPEQ